MLIGKRPAGRKEKHIWKCVLAKHTPLWEKYAFVDMQNTILHITIQIINVNLRETRDKY